MKFQVTSSSSSSLINIFSSGKHRFKSDHGLILPTTKEEDMYSSHWTKTYALLTNAQVQVVIFLHSLITICPVVVYSAINAENGEANKVRNVLTGEVGAVPATARAYKVK